MAQIPLGLMMTYSVPRMSRVLMASGHLASHFEKRLTDSVILQSAMLEYGFESGPGRTALRRMNEMHRFWRIDPEDFVMVCCEQAVTPIRLAELFGWREVDDFEKTAIAEYCKTQAKYMGVRGVPDDFDGMSDFRDKYLDRQAYFEPQNRSLTESMLDYFYKYIPRPARAASRRLLFGISDSRIVSSCGYRPASVTTRYVARTMLGLLGMRDPRPEGGPDPLESFVRAVYPDGYEISQVGTHKNG